jgi:hypothetical protein
MNPTTKVLVIAASLWGLSYEFGDLQPTAFLPKPFTPHELASVVRLLLQ